MAFRVVRGLARSFSRFNCLKRSIKHSNSISLSYNSNKYFTGIPQRYIPFETLEKLHSGPSLEDFLSQPEVENDLLSHDPNKAGRTKNSRTNIQNDVQGRNLGQKFTRNPKSKNRKPKWYIIQCIIF